MVNVCMQAVVYKFYTNRDSMGDVDGFTKPPMTPSPDTTANAAFNTGCVACIKLNAAVDTGCVACIRLANSSVTHR